MIYIFLSLPILLFILLVYFGSTYLIARRKPDPAASPKDVGLDFEDVSFQAGDGLKLGGWYIPAKDSQRTIIVCSGANGSIDSDVNVIPWLHDAGFNVLMFDWRAHGRSAGSVVSLGYYERYDLIAAIELAKSKGASKIGVLGFSMGGAIALTVAASDPSIDAIVVDGAFVNVLSAISAGLRERGLPDSIAKSIARLILLTASLRLGIPEFGTSPAEWIDRIAPRPILLLYGDRDPYVPPIEIDRLIERAGKSAEVWRVPEAGHRNLHELRSDEYRAKISRFFERNL